MKKVNVDELIKENEILMQQIRENRDKFWKSMAAVRPKKKPMEIEL
jgi:hypothetical protein